jgi:hypothetical protein
MALILCSGMVGRGASASAEGDIAGRHIQSVDVIFDGGAQDNATYRDAVLKAFAAFPGNQFDPARSDLMLTQVRRLTFVKSARYVPRLSDDGSVELVIEITLTDAARPLSQRPMGVLAGGPASDFPTLYADDRTVVQAKLENKTMVFSNTNAFFGRPDVLSAGNPLADSPSGRDGTDTWLESSVEAGVYGLSALTPRLSSFAGLSYIASASVGPELFTDSTRVHGGVEDAYAGLIGNSTTPEGGVRQLSVLVGRKAFQVDSGMILRLGSANGGQRAALQSNPRNAADQLVQVQMVHNQHKLEVFRLDPDELEELDSRTVVHGLNYEGRVLPDVRLGLMYLEVPRSKFSYFTTTSTLSREGLRVADLRLAYDPAPGRSSWYARGELAQQTHKHFDMDARAGYVEGGYRFAAWPLKPTLSYRYSRFTGDDPDTSTFERWDPLFAGGAGDEWVQGLNQYKVVQTSNVVGHRFMARLQVSPRLELTPQFWIFKADNKNNLGGAQALSFLSSRDLGKEVNITGRYVSSAKLIYVFSAAYTRPGEAIRTALNGDYKNWFSASALMIARF